MSAVTTRGGTRIEVFDKGVPHGLCTTQKDQVNSDLLAYLKT